MRKAFLAVFLFLTTGLLHSQEKYWPSPSTPIRIREDTLDLSGQQWQLDPQGLPGQIRVFYLPGRKKPPSMPTDLLAETIHFHFTRQSDGKDIHWLGSELNFTVRMPDSVRWQAINRSDEMQMQVDGSLSSDGWMSYTVKMTAFQDLVLKDITLHIPFQKEFGKYMKGLGVDGKLPDSTVVWKWNGPAGRQAETLIGNDSTALLFQLSCSCGDQLTGGIAVGIKGRSLLLNNYCGGSNIRKGETLYYRFQLQIRAYPGN
jgi:hypothetical protein